MDKTAHCLEDLDIKPNAEAGWGFALTPVEGESVCSTSGKKATHATDCGRDCYLGP